MGTEVAGSVVCLIVAALLVTSFTRLLSVERGFDSARLVTAELASAAGSISSADQGLRFLRALSTALVRCPASALGVTDRLPLTGFSTARSWSRACPCHDSNGRTPTSGLRGDYFETMGIGACAGRLLTTMAMRDGGSP